MRYQTISLTTGLFTGLLAAGTALAGHHKASEEMKPIAAAGQVVVVYEVPCVNPDQGITTLKELIRYEAGKSPIAYMSVATKLDDALVGAVDVHQSMAAMQQAFAWQEADETWLAIQAEALKACEAQLDQISMSIHSAQ